MRHTYWIPTNRLVGPCVASYAREVVACQREHALEIPLVVLDSGDRDVEAQNAAVLAHVAAALPDLRLVHVRLEEQEALVAAVLAAAGLPPDWSSCFVPRRTDYSAVMNKIFLLARGLGSTVVHRRDSDTFLQTGCPFPLEKELLYLGERSPEPAARLVGSGYVGEWNLDIKDFAEGDDAAFSAFLSCLSVPEPAHRAFIDETVKGCLERFQGDDRVHEGKQPEAGNFAVRDVHHLFPCGPADLTLGSDYFTFKMVESFGMGMVFHQRRVVHEYHRARREGPYLRRYLRALMKLCDQSPVHWHVQHTFLEPSRARNPAASAASHVAEVSRGLRTAPALAAAVRVENQARFVAEIVGRYYPAERAHCAELGPVLIEECNADYARHAELIDAWPAIMAAASAQEGVFARVFGRGIAAPSPVQQRRQVARPNP